ncbi:hypothetical protein SERLADRAFT_405872 [Serpula lacrymans var. lacrymans S7.9]|uniref:Uncharacterized protein n=1 Tax=Serpula lacrymans var. lacrymans (strain S7.9) TaxID=578457 RepID=F8NJN8_SERL9|nr:uncharacterized protein SERLADRAFT_405872 [Serpula lacrymans var. lacrymans S7.9]EGO28253.1 hypothetical protein SERLADRAFT_405872 [Serpula lacrymans var. lacrymans S7.9]
MPNTSGTATTKMAQLQAQRVKEEKWQVDREEVQKAEKEKEKMEAVVVGEGAGMLVWQACACANFRAANHRCKEDGNGVVGPSKGKRMAVESEELEVAKCPTKRKKTAAPVAEKLKEGWQAQIVGLLGALLEEQRATRQLLADLGEENRWIWCGRTPMGSWRWEKRSSGCFEEMKHFNVHGWGEQEDEEEEEEEKEEVGMGVPEALELEGQGEE